MRDILTSPRVEDMKRKRKKYRIRLSILLSILFVSVFGALAYFSGYSRVTITTITVSGNHIIDTSDIKNAVTADLSGRYMHLFSRSNALIYPKNKIYNDLVSLFPRIETLKIYRTGLNTLAIGLVERAGAYLYCGETIPQNQNDVGEHCFFVNDNGYIFDKAPYFSGNVYFKYYMKLPITGSPLGSQMLPKEQFQPLVNFIEKIKDLGFDPIYMQSQENGENVLYLNHQAGGVSPTILFNMSNDLPTIFQNLRIAMDKPEFADEIHSKYDTLQYIDLRFKNKVLYKFQ